MSSADLDMARDVTEVSQQTLRSVTALGRAIHAAHVPASAPLARAVQAEQNLYDQIDREFGLLTSTQAGRQLGSRSAAPRNSAIAARRDGRLVAIQRGTYLLFPAFQFDQHGARAVMAQLIDLARQHERTETGLVQWCCAPTTYLDGQRPVDVLDDPERVTAAAAAAFGVQW